VGSLVTAGGDFCKIIGGGVLDCNPLMLDTGAAAPIIDADTIFNINKLVNDIITTLNGIPSGASNTFDDIGDKLDDAIDCLFNDNCD